MLYKCKTVQKNNKTDQLKLFLRIMKNWRVETI